MTPSELYDQIVSHTGKDLVSFLNKAAHEIRLTFLQAKSSVENTNTFSRVLSALAQKRLAKEIISTPELQSFYTHLAFYFKKANNRAYVDNCTTHIEESVFRKRLSAWLHHKRYNKHSSHITEFRNYLKKLNDARIDGYEDYTYEILSDLYEYKNVAIANLATDIKKEVLALLGNDDLAAEFPILLQFQEDILQYIPDVEVLEYDGKEYIPTVFAESIFNKNFYDYVYNKDLFGYSIIDATEKIIGKGQADFDKGYKALTPSDVVKVYCYCNMRMHYFSSLSLYERSEIVSKFYSSKGKIKFIDIGCGPGTSGLAFADYILESTGQPAAFDYFGIDKSSAMKNQAIEMMSNEGFLKSNILAFYSDIGEINIGDLSEASCIVLNACYVFASSSLPIQSIADFIIAIKEKYPYVPKYLLFQNPRGISVNERYVEFKSLLTEHEIGYSCVSKIYYYTQRNISFKAKEREIYYELLKL